MQAGHTRPETSGDRLCRCLLLLRARSSAGRPPQNQFPRGKSSVRPISEKGRRACRRTYRSRYAARRGRAAITAHDAAGTARRRPGGRLDAFPGPTHFHGEILRRSSRAAISANIRPYLGAERRAIGNSRRRPPWLRSVPGERVRTGACSAGVEPLVWTGVLSGRGAARTDRRAQPALSRSYRPAPASSRSARVSSACDASGTPLAGVPCGRGLRRRLAARCALRMVSQVARGERGHDLTAASGAGRPGPGWRDDDLVPGPYHDVDALLVARAVDDVLLLPDTQAAQALERPRLPGADRLAHRYHPRSHDLRL